MMITEDLDRYYTPPDVASDMVGFLGGGVPANFIDTSCGNGDLLRAAENRFPLRKYMGMDVDAGRIRALRRLHPKWILSAADFLSPASRGRAAVCRQSSFGVLLANPPFSMGVSKGVLVDLDGGAVRCSVAMRHILESVEVFRPQYGVISIVPESLMFSDLDAVGREHLARAFTVDVLARLNNTTFRGARANALIVRLAPGASVALPVGRVAAEARLSCELVRGGVPLHEARYARGMGEGVPLLHTTDLQAIGARGEGCTARVVPLNRGVVSGRVVLLPRVGFPVRSAIREVHLPGPFQLSDCVIAIRGKNRESRRVLLAIFEEKFDGLVSLYRGTGASYITIRRLEDWLREQGADVTVARSSPSAVRI